MANSYEIKKYSTTYNKQVVDLVLDIQNNEAKINLPFEEQIDLQNIENYFIKSGGMFWIALKDNNVIGTIGLKKVSKDYAVLKKFFVKKAYRNQQVGLCLYKELFEFCKINRFKYIILDTPKVAKQAQKFYLKSGFYFIDKENLPFEYTYPDRDSVLMILEI